MKIDMNELQQFLNENVSGTKAAVLFNKDDTYSKPEWDESSATCEIKYNPVPGDKAVQAKAVFHILEGNESPEHFCMWMLQMKNHLDKFAEDELLKQSILERCLTGEASRVFLGHIIYRKAETDAQGVSDELLTLNNWFGFKAAAGKTASEWPEYVASSEFAKEIRKEALDKLRDHFFGTGNAVKYAVVYQKRYMRQHRFRLGSTTVKNFYFRLKELNSYLPLFPPNQVRGANKCSCGATIAANPILGEDKLIEILAAAVPPEYGRRASDNRWDMMAKSISATVGYLTTVEESVIWAAKVEAAGKRPLGQTNKKDNGGGGKRKCAGMGSPGSGSQTKRKKGRCPHCHSEHWTSKEDFSGCQRMIAGRKKGWEINLLRRKEDKKKSKK